ncbi:MAG TPA: hypothetical protein VFQ51_01640 [Vicinamibacteria bacterium]|nr:hypothetical protein [Vicinamibacteria bacterium]
MSHKTLAFLAGAALVAIQGLVPPSVYAVGNGLPFGFRETPIPGAQMNAVFANSLDFTYHDCTDFTAPGVFTERGYLWLSSFQDAPGVVLSQLNHFLPNGYKMYARYIYEGEECGRAEMCQSDRTRVNYPLHEGSIQLFLDPLQDTVLGLNNCAVTVANNADDVPLGGAPISIYGEKTETDDRINGDFEIEFANWQFSAFGLGLFRDVNGNPLQANRLVINGNVTRLLGPLGADHRPEGSGNLFWLWVD